MQDKMKPSIAAVHPELQKFASKMPQFSMSAKSLRFLRSLSRLFARAPEWFFELLTRAFFKTPKMPAGIQVKETFIASQDQTQIRIRIYQPPAAPSKTPALLWMHGGGYIIGAPEQDDSYVVPFVQEIGMVVVSVDYRLAPDHPFPAPLEDCYAALQWLAAQAETLAIDPHRIAIGGESAGAGLAAALAQLAHDRGGIRPVFQLLIYPMLDDRTAAREDIDPQAHFVWNNASNRFGWESYLNQPCAAETVPAGSVPARRADLAGLPPAWIGVGTLDLFYNEDVAYARRLKEAGIPCELVTVPGAFHGFDLSDPEIEVVKDFRESQVRALKNALSSAPPSASLPSAIPPPAPHLPACPQR